MFAAHSVTFYVCFIRHCRWLRLGWCEWNSTEKSYDDDCFARFLGSLTSQFVVKIFSLLILEKERKCSLSQRHLSQVLSDSWNENVGCKKIQRFSLRLLINISSRWWWLSFSPSTNDRITSSLFAWRDRDGSKVRQFALIVSHKSILSTQKKVQGMTSGEQENPFTLVSCVSDADSSPAELTIHHTNFSYAQTLEFSTQLSSFSVSSIVSGEVIKFLSHRIKNYYH